jgi:hypothetical protein
LEGALNYWSVRGDNVGPGSTEWFDTNIPP